MNPFEVIMSNILVVLLILLFTCQSGFCNLFAKHYPGDKRYSSQIYSVFYGLIVSLTTLLFAGFSFKPSTATLLLGLLNGAVLVTYNAMLIKASSAGPFSVVMIFNLSGGILIPMLWSIVVDKIKLAPLQYAAIALMLVSFVFLNLEDKNQKRESSSPVSAKFLLYTLLLGLANGVYGTLLNIQKNLMNQSENAEMIIATFASSAVFAFFLLLLQAGKSAFPGFRQTAKSAIFMTAASVSAAAAVNTLMYALRFINVAVLYAMDNGGVLLISVLWSVVFLKEKLGHRKLIGLILALIAIFALGVLQN